MTKIPRFQGAGVQQDWDRRRLAEPGQVPRLLARRTKGSAGCGRCSMTMMLLLLLLVLHVTAGRRRRLLHPPLSSTLVAIAAWNDDDGRR
jgi:hypothetical protein